MGGWSQDCTSRVGEERKKETPQKVVKIHIFKGLGDANGANDAE